MTSTRRAIAVSLLLVALGGCLPTQAQAPLPLVDVHNHFIPGMTAETMVGLMDQAGIQKTVLMANRIAWNRPMGWEDDLVLDIYRTNPQRFIPFLTTVRRGGVPLSDFARYVEYVEGQLKTGQFKGMGEFMVKHFAIAGSADVAAPELSEPADSPYMLEMMRLGAKYGVPLVFHMETTSDSVAALDRALTANPRTKVIWAHQNPVKMGGGPEARYARQADPDQIGALLDKHSNLYADISVGFETLYQGPEDRSLPPKWVRLYEKYSDRFMIGLDLATNTMWERGYLPRTARIRGWLSQLKPETARKLATQNIERVLSSNP